MPSEPTTAIASDLFCLKCHYNLRALSPDSRCPECAAPIADSIRFDLRGGRRFGVMAWGAVFLALSVIVSLLNDYVVVEMPFSRSWGFRFPTFVRFAVNSLFAALLLTGVILLVKSRPARDRALRPWIGPVLISLAIMALLLQITAGALNLYIHTVYSPAVLQGLVLLGAIWAADGLALLAAGYIFLRRFAHELHRPLLALFSLACFAAAAIEPALQLVQSSAELLALHGISQVHFLLSPPLFLPSPVLTFIDVSSSFAMISNWLAFAFIARFRHSDNFLPHP